MSYGVGGLSRSDSEKSVRACQAASWLGAVQIGLESGRDLPAVPVGHEPHPGRGTAWTTQVGTVAWGQDCLRSPRAGPSARRIPPRASLPCGRCPLYDQTRPDAAVVPARAHTCAQKEAPSPGPGPRYLSHVLDAVHAPPRPRCGPSGRRPGDQRGPSARIAPVVDHREEDSSSGRRCHSRTASATASVILEMVPTLSTRAERGGQVVLDIPHRHSTGASGLVIHTHRARPDGADPCAPGAG